MDKKDKIKWNKEARRVLRREMKIRDIGYKELLRRLEAIDVDDETERSLPTKISRGTFSMVFFLQCMRAMGVKTLDVSGEPVTSAKETD